MKDINGREISIGDEVKVGNGEFGKVEDIEIEVMVKMEVDGVILPWDNENVNVIVHEGKPV